MLISLAGYLGVAIMLTARFGNHGLWCAMLAFMALRAMTLALRLPGIERKSFAIAEDPVGAHSRFRLPGLSRSRPQLFP